MISFTVFGQPCSKANSRRLVHFGKGDQKRISSIKSKEALTYVKDFIRQVPSRARQMLEGPVAVTITIYYESQRPDLDESLILDAMQPVWTKTKPRALVQAGVYMNDRQVREKHIFHAIDRVSPRAVINVVPLQPQQIAAPLLPRIVATDAVPF